MSMQAQSGRNGGEAPLGYAEPKDELGFAYDDDVVGALDHEWAGDRGDDFAEWVP